MTVTHSLRALGEGVCRAGPEERRAGNWERLGLLKELCGGALECWERVSPELVLSLPRLGSQDAEGLGQALLCHGRVQETTQTFEGFLTLVSQLGSTSPEPFP